MTVTEINRAVGSWTLKLRSDTPRSILRSLEYLGHIAVVPGRVDVAQYGNNLLSAARYVGVFQGQDRRDEFTLKGAGMAFWLGDGDSKGDVLETEVNLAGATFANAIRAVLPPNGSIIEGTLNNIAGTYTGRHIYQTPRAALDYIVDIFGGEWKVNGNGTLDAGIIEQLYRVDPQALLIRKAEGSDLFYRVMPGHMALSTDVEDYTTRVLLLAEGEGSTIATGEASAPVVPFKDLHGNPVQITRLISESGTLAGNANARAQLQLNRFSGSRNAVSLSTADYDVNGDFVVGDYVYVYDPDTGFVDTTNEINWQGNHINPIALRCIEMTWPVRDGWTVGFRRSSDGTWIDLSDYFIPETGDTTVIVGEFNRSLVSAGGEPIGNRPNTGGVDTSIPAAPTFTGFSPGSYQSTNTSYTRSAIRAQWAQPLNQDGSTIVDGDHYEIRYRVNQVIGYPVTWDQLAAYTWDGLGTWDAPLSQPVQASPQWMTAFVGWDQTSFTLTELTPGVNYEIQIRAVDAASPPNFSPWSASSYVVTVGDIFAPSTPAPPTVAASRVSIQVEHALGKSSGGAFNLELDLDHLDVHLGGSNAFMPDESNKIGELIANAAMVTARIPAVGTFQVEQTDEVWIKVVAVDSSGNKSSASPASNVTALLIDNAHISDLSVSKLTAGTITAQTVLASDIEVGSGGTITVTQGRVQIKDGLGRTVVELGKGSTNNLYGLYVYEPGVTTPVLELGQTSELQIGLQVNDQAYNTLVQLGHTHEDLYGLNIMNASRYTQVQAGELQDGDYGFAAVDEFGRLAKLSTLVFGPKVSSITTSQSTTSNSYVNLATVGPTISVAVGQTGKVLLGISCNINFNTDVDETEGAYLSFTASGANTISAGSYEGYHIAGVIGSGADTDVVGMLTSITKMWLIEGLNPGTTTFQMKYKVFGSSASPVNFSDRILFALPY